MYTSCSQSETDGLGHQYERKRKLNTYLCILGIHLDYLTQPQKPKWYSYVYLFFQLYEQIDL